VLSSIGLVAGLLLIEGSVALLCCIVDFVMARLRCWS
jgi:hypothetical protein